MPVTPKKTQAQEAEDKEQEAVGRYAKAVINLERRGKLRKLDSEFSAPKWSKVIPSLESAITDWKLVRARRDSDFNADPDVRDFLYETQPEQALRKVYSYAQSTFSEPFMQRIAAITPQQTDSTEQKIDAAIRYTMGSKLKNFVEKNEKVQKWVDDVTKLRLKSGGGNYNDVKSLVTKSLKDTLESDELVDYMGFVKDVLAHPDTKQNLKSSFFSPWVWGAPRLNKWITQATGREADIRPVAGKFIQAGDDFDVDELPGLSDGSTKQMLYDKRLGSISKAFTKWRAAKRLKEAGKPVTGFELNPKDFEE